MADDELNLLNMTFYKSVGRKKAATYAFALKLQADPNADSTQEMGELMSALEEFLNAQGEKSTHDANLLLRRQMGCCACLAAGQLKSHSKLNVDMQMQINRSNPGAVITNIMKTGQMYSKEELEKMLQSAREVQKTGNVNIAAQLDSQESIRAQQFAMNNRAQMGLVPGGMQQTQMGIGPGGVQPQMGMMQPQPMGMMQPQPMGMNRMGMNQTGMMHAAPDNAPDK